MTANLVQGTVQTTEHVLFFTLVQVTVIIIAARVAGYLARRVGQPRAVGEIVAGLLLGPSLFGVLAPETFRLIFRATDTLPISIMSQIGLIMLMFQIGLEFDFSHLKSRENKRAVSLISVMGIVVPFVLGLAFGYGSAPHLASGIPVSGYALFMATAFSITAVPILGRIMMEFDLTRTRIGVITISSAAINDAVGWTLLAFISAVVTAHFSVAGMLMQVASLLLYVIVCWYVVRQVLRLLVRRFDFDGQALPQDLMAILLVIVFTSAMLTSKLGIFAIFGGFMMGVLLHDQHGLVEAWKHKVADLVTVFFLPIFFTYTGLRTDVGGLETAELWFWCAGLVSLAVMGKFGGCYIAARLSGLKRPEARNIAIMMNTRALMELVVVNLGFDLGVIPSQVFTMLVLMAIASTIMTAPGLRAWLPSMGHAIPAGRDA
ncbi:cation:proton antiporter [Methylocaldum sp.]|uniref:cation:proton antiporter n=1 Tax=Methylocaldum sp. TaxID=1969727 RepID=UPI002D359376|nr:cation:proton antiporter [Methylocaldum sp.]HYE36821.1 cation:proton antiporter [Methylocaldum sp.]